MKLKLIGTAIERAWLEDILKPYVRNMSKPYDGRADGCSRYHCDIFPPVTVTESHKPKTDKARNTGEIL